LTRNAYDDLVSINRSFYSSGKLYRQVLEELIPLYDKKEAGQLAKMLMEEVLSISFEKIMIDEKLEIDPSILDLFQEKIDLVKKYLPIQYALGKAHFYGRDFVVNPNVLIPRQETEELIREILIDNKKPNLNILDIGSGSGCICITLALELPNSKVTALDVNGGALDVTLKNAEQYGLTITCLLEDILSMDHLPGKYDIIVSNPPYITEKEKGEMLNNVLDHEPHQALFVPNNDPLRFYKKIISLAKNHLKENGKLYFEINEHFGAEMIKLCETAACSCVKLVQDINGRDRIIKATFD